MLLCAIAVLVCSVESVFVCSIVVFDYTLLLRFVLGRSHCYLFYLGGRGARRGKRVLLCSVVLVSVCCLVLAWYEFPCVSVFVDVSLTPT